MLRNCRDLTNWHRSSGVIWSIGVKTLRNSGSFCFAATYIATAMDPQLFRKTSWVRVWERVKERELRKNLVGFSMFSKNRTSIRHCSSDITISRKRFNGTVRNQIRLGPQDGIVISIFDIDFRFPVKAQNDTRCFSLSLMNEFTIKASDKVYVCLLKSSTRRP